MVREGQGIHMEMRGTARLCVPAVVLLLMAMGVFSAPAQTFEEAVAAYERGDYAAAYGGFQVHAEQGDASAQYNLGYMYLNGEGVPQDYAGAAKWFRRAADQAFAPAQLHLGTMYHKGQGVPQDYAEAAKWFHQAADQGFGPAQFLLGFMYDNGQGVPQDYTEAAKWYRQAADRGDASAQLNLGLMYHKGQGVPQDFVQAYLWLNLSASRRSDKRVQELRDEVAARLTPADLALAQRLSREWQPKAEGTYPAN